MASRNSRTNGHAARSSRTPQSARAVRTARAAQSGRIASRGTVRQYSRDRGTRPPASSGYRSSYNSGRQGREPNAAYSRRTAAGQYSRTNPHYAQKGAKRMGRGKKIALGVFAALLVAVVGAGTAFALYINSINTELNRGGKSDNELSAIQDVLAPKKSFDQPFYMMLIGSDKRDGDEEAGARSDTNIVAWIDPTKNLASLVSIPRDTMIDVDGEGRAKFNAAYNFGGASATIREASQLLGVDISHYAEINFDEMVQLVDAVGGVDVDVTERIDDPDADNTTDNPGGKRIIIEAGPQHLDGESALVFARSRAFVDGDFTRTANQRKLISALVEKIVALPVTELPGVLSAASKCVTTDLSVNDIISLAQQFKDDGDLTVYSAMVPSVIAPQLIDGVSYVFNDPEATKKMMEVVEEGGDPSTVVSTADPQSLYSSQFGSRGGSSGRSSSGGGGSGGGSSGGGGSPGGVYYSNTPNDYGSSSSSGTTGSGNAGGNTGYGTSSGSSGSY